jgi:uncharacterized MAPEG superfamily protein
MTAALWCVLAAAFLHIPFSLAAKSGGRFDNANPRRYLAGLDGWHARANAAQMNSIEVFPAFAAVIIATTLHAPQAKVDLLAFAFIGLRIAFGLLYIANLATLRSLVWVASMACVVALFVVAA